MKIYSFEKLEVWKNARDFTVKIYSKTKAFPDEEKFGLTNQSIEKICSFNHL